MAGALTAAIAAAFSGGAAAATDPYYEYTTLLLPGSGTNGAQNNTFLDGSTNNFTITRNGNTTQGTFSPFSQTGWGNYFDGSGDSLTIPSGSSISGTGNFTVEFWIYPTTFASGYQVPYINETSGGFAVLVNSTGTLSYGRALVAVDGTTTGTVTFNQWNHVAFVRSGTGSNQFICYINGSSAGAFTNSTNYSSGIVRLGTDAGGTSFPFLGYLSNVRNVTVAVYTGAFTPPTSPLAATQSAGTNISAITGTQTSLLTCQSNRFIDNSTNNFTITRNGDTRVVAFSPFNPTASWSSATYGGSGYFDGSGDYLTVPDNAALELGTANFTIELWVYPTSFTATTNNFLIGKMTNSTTASGFLIRLADTTGTALFYASSNGSTWDIANSVGTVAPTLNTWNHIAVSRSGSNFRIWVNGVSGGTTTSSGSIQNNTSVVGIGAVAGGGGTTFGYISDARIVNGTAVYDPTQTTITVPTAPLTAITNTSLLLNFTNAGIYDATSKNDLETVGNAQISTAQYKFPPSSMAFDGTGDYLDISPSRFSSFGTGNFTVEFWMRTAGSAFNIINPATATGTGYWALLVQTSIGGFRWNDAYDVTNLWTQTATSVLDNNWHHIAIVRNGTGSGNVNIYFDGVAQGTAKTDSTNYNGASTAWRIGSGNVGALNGYIQDLRITPGIARYTANFTPPTAAFPTL